MSNSSILSKYVSHKISKVRWRPVTGTNSEHPTVFLTGGCDRNEGNMLALWMVPAASTEAMGSEDVDSLDEEPASLCEATQKGDVTDVMFLDRSAILSASSNGDLNLFGYTEEFQHLKLDHCWNRLHNNSLAGMASLPRAEMVATVGKEGGIKLLHDPLVRPDSLPVTVTDTACHTAPNAVKFLQRSTVAVVNDAGQLRLWDATEGRRQPSKVFELLTDAVPFLCMDQHPSQSHVVVAGAENGSLYVWDLRQESRPVAIHRGHQCDVLEVKFHQDLPNNLFTCSEDGSLWHWGSNQSTSSILFSTKMEQTLDCSVPPSSSAAGSNHWLLSDSASRGRLVVNDMLAGNSFPVNSLDVAGSRVVAGLDTEQLFVFSDVVIC